MNSDIGVLVNFKNKLQSNSFEPKLFELPDNFDSDTIIKILPAYTSVYFNDPAVMVITRKIQTKPPFEGYDYKGYVFTSYLTSIPLYTWSDSILRKLP